MHSFQFPSLRPSLLPPPHHISLSLLPPSLFVFCSTASTELLFCLSFKPTVSVLSCPVSSAYASWRLALSFRQTSSLLTSRCRSLNSLRRSARWATELLKLSFAIKRSTVERARRACELWNLLIVHRALGQTTTQSSPRGMPFAQLSGTSEYSCTPKVLSSLANLLDT